MRTEDHLDYARLMVDRLNISPWKKRAFKLGCIMPDYNKFTYMGHHLSDWSLGHSYRVRKKEIIHFFRRPYADNILWWYQAGLRIHYLGDSFSRPHNPEFGYRSRPHVAYEWKLHDVMQQILRDRRFHAARVRGDFRSWLEQRHASYMEATKGIEQDSYFIDTTLMGVWNWVERHVLPSRILPPDNPGSA